MWEKISLAMWLSMQFHRYLWVKSSRTLWLVLNLCSLVYLFTLECVCMPLGRCTSSRATSGLFEMQSSTESPVLEITLLYNPGSFCRPACLHQCLHFTAQPQMLLWPACYLELACTNYHSPYIWETQLGNTDTDRLIENQTVQ